MPIYLQKVLRWIWLLPIHPEKSYFRWQVRFVKALKDLHRPAFSCGISDDDCTFSLIELNTEIRNEDTPLDLSKNYNFS